MSKDNVFELKKPEYFIMGLRIPPFAFTRHGVLMLSSVRITPPRLIFKEQYYK
ncbi:MAG: hypothetical protein JRD05_10500 [Deltaproteobacteria bacterium]|nr:hypothetical protein [Deltaproteobacteria bacterium]